MHGRAPQAARNERPDQGSDMDAPTARGFAAHRRGRAAQGGLRFLTGTRPVHRRHQPPGPDATPYILRSPHAHARIRAIDTAAATAMPGVVAHLHRRGHRRQVDGLPCGWLIHSTDGTPMKEPPHPVLAIGKVRYVGDHGRDGRRRDAGAGARTPPRPIEVDYDVLPAVVERARRDEPAPPAVHDEAPGNMCYDWHIGDKAAVDAAFARRRARRRSSTSSTTG